MNPHYSIQETRESARRVAAQFCGKTEGASYEQDGVFFSEMLFLYATLQGRSHRQILESGRSRGQSTELLARLFPESRIVSVEYKPDNEEAAIAEERLRPHRNVCPLFGDARILLPHLLLPGDAVLIDGPKSFKAIRLAIRALKTGKASVVFIHDLYLGHPCRTLLDRFMPGVFSSDDQEFVAEHRHLDEACWEKELDAKEERYYAKGDFRPDRSYGPTLSCIPHSTSVSYTKIETQMRIARRMTRIRSGFKKRITPDRDSSKS